MKKKKALELERPRKQLPSTWLPEISFRLYSGKKKHPSTTVDLKKERVSFDVSSFDDPMAWLPRVGSDMGACETYIMKKGLFQAITCFPRGYT